MAIIRFLDDTGQIRYGEPQKDDTAKVLQGDLLGDHQVTDKVVNVSRLLAPIEPTNIFAIGLNYRRHAQETKAQLPKNPVVFMKATTAVCHPGDPIRLPACATRGPEVDYECELAVIIGREALNVPVERALEHVLGYTCANDVSARRWQKHGGAGQWVRGKSFDTFCPLGPRLMLADEIGDPQSLAISSTLNGQVMQSSNTSDMIFPVAELISFLSQDTRLLPGTVILTGTPEGVGFVRQPPVFLQSGDQITIEIDGIGKLTNPVEAAS